MAGSDAGEGGRRPPRRTATRAPREIVETRHMSELAGILKATGDRIGRGFRDRRAGHGRLNVAAALRMAEARINPRSRA